MSRRSHHQRMNTPAAKIKTMPGQKDFDGRPTFAHFTDRHLQRWPIIHQGLNLSNAAQKTIPAIINPFIFPQNAMRRINARRWIGSKFPSTKAGPHNRA
jgi:hypothetical protein